MSQSTIVENYNGRPFCSTKYALNFVSAIAAYLLMISGNAWYLLVTCLLLCLLLKFGGVLTRFFVKLQIADFEFRQFRLLLLISGNGQRMLLTGPVVGLRFKFGGVLTRFLVKLQIAN